MEAMIMNNVTDQTAQAEAQAKADAEAEEEARLRGEPVKRQKTDHTHTSLQHARIHQVQIRKRVGDSRDCR